MARSSTKVQGPAQDNAAPASRPDHGTTASAGPDGYVFSNQIGHLLRRAYQRHLAIFQQNASDPNLTSIQFVTLCALRDRGPSSQAELVKSTAVDQATIRGIVHRLKARGLIALWADPDDNRKVIVRLTAGGEQVLATMIPCARQITELTVAKLNPAERLAVEFVLRKMIESDTNGA